MIVNYALACLVGLAAGLVLGYLYGGKEVAKYKEAARLLGITFEKIEGTITAIRKAL